MLIFGFGEQNVCFEQWFCYFHCHIIWTLLISRTRPKTKRLNCIFCCCWMLLIKRSWLTYAESSVDLIILLVCETVVWAAEYLFTLTINQWINENKSHSSRCFICIFYRISFFFVFFFFYHTNSRKTVPQFSTWHILGCISARNRFQNATALCDCISSE